MAEFRITTAGEFDLFADGNTFFDLLDSPKDRTFAFGDLGRKPLVELTNCVFAGFNFVCGGSTRSVGPLVAERCAAADIDIGVVPWTGVSMAVDDCDVFEFFRR